MMIRFISSFIFLNPIICFRIMYSVQHRLHTSNSMSEVEIEEIKLPKQTEYIGDEMSEWDGYMVLEIKCFVLKCTELYLVIIGWI